MRYAAILRLLRTLVYPLSIAAVVCAFTAGRPVADGEQTVVTLVADGQTQLVTTTAKCVAEVLAENGIALGELDRVTPKLETPVVAKLKIRVVRVVQKIEEREAPIPPGSITRFDARVGRAVILDPGKPGLKRETVSIFLKDGQETERSVLASRVIKEPVPKRVVIGRSRSLPARGARMMLMKASAYDPGPLSCGKYASGRTAIGMKAGKGVVAVDPRVIPLGTRLYIEGYGPAVAGDVGSAIRGGRIDLGFETRREALAFGRRVVKVYTLD